MIMAAALAAAVLVGPPAFAKGKKSSSCKPSSKTCTKVKDAIASGKSAEDVQKEMKVSESCVKKCTAPPAEHHKKTTAKKS
jgi:hypothetical protein